VSPSSDAVGRARELLAARLSAESYAHCQRTAAAAVELAGRFGVDVTSAELAGLLHDYARDEDPSGLVAAAGRLGVPVLPLEMEHPYLLHARVGAAMARRDLPGIDEAVLSAISVHTVGGVPMSDLDKVVYLADMIEPSRDFRGLAELRAACEREPLDECFRLAYGGTLRHLKERGRPVHPISAAVGARIERETGRALDPDVPYPGTSTGSVPEPESDFAPQSGTDGAPAQGGPTATVARHGRRRHFGRAHHASSAPAARRTRAGIGHRFADAVGRGLRTALSVALIVVVLMGSLWGLAVGINVFARWNARRVAAAGTRAAQTSQNLLVIGVRDGAAIGFAALKVERDTKRVLGIAIPEGAFVEVPGQGFERIGVSYNDGPAVSASAVSNYFGIQFERYVVVDGDTYQALLQDQDISSITGKIALTNLTSAERASLSGFLKATSAKDVWIVPLPVKAMTAGTERYFEPQRAEVADLLLQWWGVRADQQKTRPRVIVYNGVGTPGLASEAAQQLIRAGFQVVDSGNADHFGYTATAILVYHAPTEAPAVRAALGVGAIRMQSAPQEIADMIVILGTDYLPPVSVPSTVPTEGAR
jgi:predicted HD superfamily hydrolase involved in NAD metabolism